MATQQSAGTLQVSELSLPVLNDRLHQIQDYIDSQQGLSGPVQLYDNPQLNQTTKTASLSAASASMNGTILLEDAGSSFNLIYYAGGKRYRVTGTSF